MNNLNNKPSDQNGRNWVGRSVSAGVGATIAGSVSAANGQSPLVTLLVITCATVLTLVCDEYGLI
jgi:hypothetical protein